MMSNSAGKDDAGGGLSVTFMVKEPFTEERLTEILNAVIYLEAEGLTEEAAWHVIRSDGSVIPFAAKRYKRHKDRTS